MGTYYRVANLDRQEILISPYAQKDGEWNHPGGRSANVVLWALWRRWSGDRVEVINDNWDDEWDRCRSWPNVWATVEAEYLREIVERPREPAVIYCHECSAAVPFDLTAVT